MRIVCITVIIGICHCSSTLGQEMCSYQDPFVCSWHICFSLIQAKSRSNAKRILHSAAARRKFQTNGNTPWKIGPRPLHLRPSHTQQATKVCVESAASPKAITVLELE
eukprot:c13697_g1_i1 orf=229-552(+)